MASFLIGSAIAYILPKIRNLADTSASTEALSSSLAPSDTTEIVNENSPAPPAAASTQVSTVLNGNIGSNFVTVPLRCFSTLMMCAIDPHLDGLIMDRIISGALDGLDIMAFDIPPPTEDTAEYTPIIHGFPIFGDDIRLYDNEPRSANYRRSSIGSNTSTLVDTELPKWMQDINLVVEYPESRKTPTTYKVVADFIERNGHDFGVTNKWHDTKIQEIEEDMEEEMEDLKAKHTEELEARKQKFEAEKKAMVRILKTMQRLRESGLEKINEQVKTTARLADENSALKEQISELHLMIEEKDKSMKEMEENSIKWQDHIDNLVQQNQSIIVEQENIIQNAWQERQNLQAQLHTVRLAEEHPERYRTQLEAADAHIAQLSMEYRKAVAARDEYLRACKVAEDEKVLDGLRLKQAVGINENQMRRIKEMMAERQPLERKIANLEADKQYLSERIVDLENQLATVSPFVQDVLSQLLPQLGHLKETGITNVAKLAELTNDEVVQELSEWMEEFTARVVRNFEVVKKVVEENGRIHANCEAYRKELSNLERSFQEQADKIGSLEHELSKMEWKFRIVDSAASWYGEEYAKVKSDADRVPELEEKITHLQAQLATTWESAAPEEWEDAIQQQSAKINDLRMELSETEMRLEEIQKEKEVHEEMVYNTKELFEQVQEWKDKCRIMEHHYGVSMMENNRLRARLGLEVVPHGQFDVTPQEVRMIGRRALLASNVYDGTNYDPDDQVEYSEDDLRGEFAEHVTPIDREPTTLERVAGGILDRMAELINDLRDPEFEALKKLHEEGSGVNKPQDLISTPELSTGQSSTDEENLTSDSEATSSSEDSLDKTVRRHQPGPITAKSPQASNQDFWRQVTEEEGLGADEVF